MADASAASAAAEQVASILEAPERPAGRLRDEARGEADRIVREAEARARVEEPEPEAD